MRKWYKYLLNYQNKMKDIPIDKSFNDHAKSMGGYNSNKGYDCKEDFSNFTSTVIIHGFNTTKTI